MAMDVKFPNPYVMVISGETKTQKRMVLGGACAAVGIAAYFLGYPERGDLIFPSVAAIIGAVVAFGHSQSMLTLDRGGGKIYGIEHRRKFEFPIAGAKVTHLFGFGIGNKNNKDFMIMARDGEIFRPVFSVDESAGREAAKFLGVEVEEANMADIASLANAMSKPPETMKAP